ncbi:MAG: MBL fold metallo-hydrolase [Phycisphaeraceae bacterium]|nr:MBL fold metallo-hydrolase [Phycisphaeraceae bacterium]
MATPVIQGFSLGPFATNCYVVAAPGGSACWVVDAGFEPDEMIDHIRETGLKPERLILTHAHIDHIAGVDEVRRAFPGLPVAIHAAEREWLHDPSLNLSAAYGLPITCHGPDEIMEDGQSLTLADTVWEVRHTPGHSPGSVTLVHAESRQAIVGDALFNGSIGRTDFPGCSFEELAESIRKRLYTLSPETRIFPGHGPPTTIGHEMRTNPFVRP